MGSTGAGKSVLLKLLTGYLRPQRGCVLIGDCDLYAAFPVLRQQIGYVPQAEIMIPELTVRSSLDYRLRLQHPGLSAGQRLAQIDEVCGDLGLTDQAANIMEQTIGSPDAQGNYPSGGQRRRINIAHELVHRPAVLFLDEPTSGLSAFDADRVVRLLRDYAVQRKRNVIMTIHQPSRDAFACLRDLLLVHRGGRTAYYGPAHQARDYFEQAGGFRMRNEDNPAEFVLNFIRNDASGTWATERYEECLRSGAPDYLFTPLPV